MLHRLVARAKKSWQVNALSPRLNIIIAFILLFIGILMLIRAGVALRSPNEQRLEANATAAATIIAIAGLFFTLGQQLADKAEARSRFYLEEYRKGYDSAYDVLDSVNAGEPILRMKWIAAARILESARRLSDKITVPSHRDVMNMDIPRQAERFEKFLRHPAAYYYGVNPEVVAIYGDDYLNEAARRSTNEIEGRMNAHTEVEEKVIFTVWDAIQYPPGYADVIGGGKFEEARVWILPLGLRDYITHARRYSSAMGKLYEGRNVVPPLSQRPAGAADKGGAS